MPFLLMRSMFCSLFARYILEAALPQPLPPLDADAGDRPS